VNLTALASLGWVFDRWEEDPSASYDITLAVMSYVERTAIFVPKPPSEDPGAWVTLRTSVEPAEALSAGCTLWPEGRTKHATGSEVPLIPHGADGWTFEGWDGANVQDIDSTQEPSVIVMNSDKQVKAVFSQKYVLTTSTKGKGTVTPASGTAYSATTPPTSVQVSATPNTAQSWTFVEWRKDASGTSPTTNVVMDGDKHAKAVFTRANKKSLTVTTPEGCKIRIEADPNGTSDGSNPTEPGTTVMQLARPR